MEKYAVGNNVYHKDGTKGLIISATELHQLLPDKIILDTDVCVKWANGMATTFDDVWLDENCSTEEEWHALINNIINQQVSTDEGRSKLARSLLRSIVDCDCGEVKGAKVTGVCDGQLANREKRGSNESEENN